MSPARVVEKLPEREKKYQSTGETFGKNMKKRRLQEKHKKGARSYIHLKG